MGGNPWANVMVRTLKGQQVNLTESWKDKRVVLFLVRRFG